MNFTSIDIGLRMGVTQWEGESRKATFIIKPMGGKGRYYFGDRLMESKRAALLRLTQGTDFIIMERGMGARANVVNAQAKVRGYLEALCDECGIQYKEINPSEWRRPIKEHLGVSWPKRSEDQKALAQQVVQKLYNINVSEDEADSICIGWSAIRLGYINTNQ